MLIQQGSFHKMNISVNLVHCIKFIITCNPSKHRLPPPPIMILMYVGLFHYLTGGSSSSTSEGMPRGGFATNFGSGVAGTGVKGVEGTIVGCIFKALVSRLAAAKDDLATPENEVSLFSFLIQLYLELMYT